MTLLEQIKADREAETPQQWQAETTTCRDLPATVWALYWDKTPGGRKNADGSTSYSMKFPMLLASDWMGNQEKSMNELADLLNFASRAKAALLAADELADAIKAVIDLENNTSPSGCEMQADRIAQTQNECIAALTAYRKATGAEQ